MFNFIKSFNSKLVSDKVFFEYYELCSGDLDIDFFISD